MEDDRRIWEKNERTLKSKIADLESQKNE